MSKCNDDTELEITCPHCGQKVNVYANCIHFKSANAMVVEDMNGE